ncbi:MAG: hypothetical protein K9H64_01630 [Bacteroidales bacterium]|nr:hypothetical protein [Bacteroidales bacterium]MCF8454605.1 hypothetical protein [Bacteroidales bacterium]
MKREEKITFKCNIGLFMATMIGIGAMMGTVNYKDLAQNDVPFICTAEKLLVTGGDGLRF